MKLTIEQVSKLTKLSIPTLRVYVSRQKLGTKVGNNRFFSQADVQKLLKGSKKTSGSAGAKAATKAPARKAKTVKAPKASPRSNPVVVKPAAQKAAPKPAPKPEKSEKPVLKTKPVRPSFWSRLFGGRGPKQKINVLEAKSTK
jgi:hypothetical protein